MTKPKTRAAVRADELRERLDDDTRDADEDTALRAQVEFWARLRAAFSSNDNSTGLEALDDLAMAALTDDSAAPLTLTGTAVLLPSPDSMSVQDPPTHALFAPETSTTRSKRPNSRKGKAKAPPAKKRRTNSKSRRSWFQLPSNAPKRIKDDLARLEDTAADQDTTPERLAYPWRGQRAWYAPDEKPDLHLMHWRFVMRHRATFFDLAVYAPTDDSSARRKQKTLACQARLLFLSYNIEEFGYYGFLDEFENSAHDHLLWLGGKAAKHSLDAKKAKDKDDAADPPQEDLAKLLRRDPSHYDKVIERVLDPSTVDEEGYTSVPELLTQSNALDPTRPAHLRLTTNALARIVLDVTDIGAPPNSSWVGNRSTGPWKKLFSDVSLLSVVPKLRKRLNKGKYVVKYDHKVFKATDQNDDDSDFEDDGQPTIKPPTSLHAPSSTHQSDHTGLTDSSDEDDDEFQSHDQHSGEEDAPSDASVDDKLNNKDHSGDNPDDEAESSSGEEDNRAHKSSKGRKSVDSSDDKAEDTSSPKTSSSPASKTSKSSK